MVPLGLLLLCASLLVEVPSLSQGACSINPYCSDCTNYAEEGQTKWRFYCNPYNSSYIDSSHFTATSDTVDFFQVKYFSSSSTLAINSGAFRNVPNIVRADIRNTRSTNPSINQFAFFYGVQNNLRTLLFRRSYLTAVPLALTYLTALQELDLGYNRITGDPSNYLSYLTSLRSLRLDYNRLLSRIPASLQHLNNLRKLSLASCDLDQSSGISFGNLPTSLEWLDVYNNQLYEVPSGIGLLQNLTYLNMGYCGLNSLSVNVFANLSKLEALELSDNPSITSYLDVLVNQKSLKVLKLSNMGSSLTDIPNAISGMEKLEELFLSSNRIRGINHGQFAKLIQLRKLNLYHNKITSLDPLSFQNCDHLEELYLGYNLIHEVSPALFVPQSLKNLNLYGNKFDTFDKCTVANLLAHLQKTDTSISSDLFICDCRLAWVRKLSAAFGSRVRLSGSCYLPRELYGQSVTSFTLSDCSLEDESFESCNNISTTPPNTTTEHPPDFLNSSFVISAQLSSLKKDLQSIQAITNAAVSVAVIALLALVATIAVLLTCFFRQRNRVPSNGWSQGHVNQGLQLSEGVQSERSPEGRSSEDTVYQNTTETASRGPSADYEPFEQHRRGWKQQGGRYTSPVVD
ncbi:carboxypeptidase N subunit 2 [Lingula anatina]|uniref:Carboxypeptidase N subunit 2 n=1 Tax=Lingula anatina TaxID=7574 RepID=A0A1S3KDY6_LINAN|nr:carboxypeptidase N subunit 2 [Lingula anatina]|eukprot:XP_013420840.1 carboxypeptidase N subunit 2 [Lingula anatina]